MTVVANNTISVRARWRSALREADADRAPAWLPVVTFWAPWVGALVLAALFVLQRDLYYAALSEDRPVEWLQFAGLLVTAALAAMAAWRLRGRPLVALLPALLAVGSFVLAGEEISWAQRAFALEAPAALAEVNKQSELNVHNIWVAGLPVETLFKGVSLLLAAGLLAVALLTGGRRPRLTGPFWGSLAVPRCCLSGPLLALLFWAAYLSVPIAPVQRFQEWAEAALYLSLGVATHAIWARTGPVRRGRQTVLVVGIALLVTAVLAALTAHHGIIPLNNPERLAG